MHEENEYQKENCETSSTIRTRRRFLCGEERYLEEKGSGHYSVKESY